MQHSKKILECSILIDSLEALISQQTNNGSCFQTGQHSLFVIIRKKKKIHSNRRSYVE